MKLGGFHQLRVIRVCGRSLAAAVAFAVGLASVSAIATPAASIADQVVATASPSAFDDFLDRLMTAESAGRVNAKNPRSTALGPFQFIKSTFLELTRRHFSADLAASGARRYRRRRSTSLLMHRPRTGRGVIPRSRAKPSAKRRLWYEHPIVPPQTGWKCRCQLKPENQARQSFQFRARACLDRLSSSLSSREPKAVIVLGSSQQNSGGHHGVPLRLSGLPYQPGHGV